MTTVIGKNGIIELTNEDITKINNSIRASIIQFEFGNSESFETGSNLFSISDYTKTTKFFEQVKHNLNSLKLNTPGLIEHADGELPLTTIDIFKFIKSFCRMPIEGDKIFNLDSIQLDD
jgi:hypothetical protein